MRIPVRAGALAAGLALALTACGGPAEGGGTGHKGAAPAAEERTDRIEPLAGPAPEPKLPAEVASADGHTVSVEDTSRVVPLTGSLNEIVFTLGLGEQVVARDITATFEQAADLPVVTRAHDVSAESVLSLKPTVVLADTTTGPAEAISQLRDAGIPLVVLDPPKSLDDIGPRIEAVASALGVAEAGKALVDRTEQRIEKVRADVPDLPAADRPRVAFLYLRGSASVYLLGGRESGATRSWRRPGRWTRGRSPGCARTSPPSPARHWPRPPPTRSSSWPRG
ncbi:hemin ABC transporter substrate-binding protein [Actinomadura keratinilytica]